MERKYDEGISIAKEIEKRKSLRALKSVLEGPLTANAVDFKLFKYLIQ